MLTLCGTCHGRVHGIMRPFRLGDLVKAGLLKAQERTAAEWRSIAQQKARQAKEAAAIARDRELEQAEAQSRSESAARKEAAALRQEAVKLVVDNSTSKPLDTEQPDKQSQLRLVVSNAERPAERPESLAAIETDSEVVAPFHNVALREPRSAFIWAGYLIEPDAVCAGMWRARSPDGSVTDMLNPSRAKDAALWHLPKLEQIAA